MTLTPPDPYLAALREDWPSRRDEARIRRRFIGTGLAVSFALVPKSVAASSSLLKTSLMSSLASRFMGLSLVSQFSVVTAATTIAITVPVWISEQSSSSSDPERHPHGVAAASNVQRVSRALPIAQPAPVTQVEPVLPPAPAGAAATRIVAKHMAYAQLEPPKPAAELSSLAEETRLLDAALSAIRAGELNRAARLLDEHELRFERAKLARERQYARKKLQEAQRHAVR